MRVALLIIALVTIVAGSAVLSGKLGDNAGAVTCYTAQTEDSDPSEAPCDYRHGGWHPVTPPVTLPACDDDTPGKPVTGPCWLADDDQVAVFSHPYAPAPIYILAGAK